MAKQDEQVNMFEFSSGLPLDGQRCHSTHAEFTYDTEYNAGACVLKITWQPVDEDGTESGEAKNQLYSLGKKWQPADEGAAVAHESGKRQQFNNMTVISKFLDSYMVARGDGDKDKGMKELIEEGADPTQASMYLGIDATLKSVSYKDLSDKDRSTFGIGEYHGKVGEAKTAKPAKLAAKTGTSKAAAKPAAEEADGEDAWKEHFGAKTYLALKKLAKAHDDHDDFMEAALELDGVADSDDKAFNKLSEKIVMEFGDDSLYATARA